MTTISLISTLSLKNTESEVVFEKLEITSFCGQFVLGHASYGGGGAEGTRSSIGLNPRTLIIRGPIYSLATGEMNVEDSMVCPCCSFAVYGGGAEPSSESFGKLLRGKGFDELAPTCTCVAVEGPLRSPCCSSAVEFESSSSLQKQLKIRLE